MLFRQLILTIIAFIIYLPSLNYDFTYDDAGQIVENKYVINQDKSIPQLLSVFSEATHPGDLYRPIVIFSLRLNYLISGFNTWSYHLTNILLHVLVVLLVYQLFCIFLRPNQLSAVGSQQSETATDCLSTEALAEVGRWRAAECRFRKQLFRQAPESGSGQQTTNNKNLAFWATLIFAIHPIHIEAVANIYNRTELLAAVFVLLTIIAYWQKHFFVAAVALLLGILSKESALTAIMLAPLFTYFISKQIPTKKSFGVLFFAVLIYFPLRFFILSDSFLVQAPDAKYYVENPLFHESFLVRVYPSFYTFGEYLRLMTLPFKFSADYSMPKDFFWEHIYSWQGVAAICLATLFFICSIYRINKKPSFFALWVIISFALTINFLVPIGTLMAERLAYLPSIGGSFLLALLLLRFHKVLILSYIIFLSFQSILRLPVWENDLVLFANTVNDNSVSPKATFIRGLHNYKADNYQIAAESFRETIFRDPHFTLAGKFLTVCYIKLKDHKRAAYWTQKVLEVEPDDADMQKAFELYFK